MEQSKPVLNGNIMEQSRTLWMGNIENWMNENYICQLLNSINLNPIKIRILQNDNPKNCCFIEFDCPETADFVLEKYNGLKINNLILHLKRVISKKNVQMLLKEGKTSKIEKFISKNNKEFSAVLKLENNKIVFDFK